MTELDGERCCVFSTRVEDFSLETFSLFFSAMREQLTQESVLLRSGK